MTMPADRRTGDPFGRMHEPVKRATTKTDTGPTLFDEVSARLPLFDGLTGDSVERLSSSGYGRGLLTASLRARLRKAGFADMGALVRASPTDLLAVRKIGPLRVAALRTHLLGELARMVPGARADHDTEATQRRRLERLRNAPTATLSLEPSLRARLARAFTTGADLAQRRRTEIGTDLGIASVDLDRIVVALMRAVQPAPSPATSDIRTRDDGVEQDAGDRLDRAELLKERDREWDAAAPAAEARPRGRS